MADARDVLVGGGVGADTELRGPAANGASRGALTIVFRILTFQATREELLSLGPAHAVLGLGLAMLAGIGRHWDAEGMSWIRHSGLGSVAYALGLSVAIWIAIAPLRPAALGFARVLAFVGMTAPPGLLYAIPVERFLDPRMAADVNVAFLFGVALWRVALLVWFLRRLTELPAGRLVLGAGMPIVTLLSAVGVVMIPSRIITSMGGWRDVSPATRAAEAAAYNLGCLGAMLVIPWGILWLMTAVSRVPKGPDVAVKSVPSAAPKVPPPARGSAA